VEVPKPEPEPLLLDTFMLSAGCACRAQRQRAAEMLVPEHSCAPRASRADRHPHRLVGAGD
jgi:hypothetical protein